MGVSCSKISTVKSNNSNNSDDVPKTGTKTKTVQLSDNVNKQPVLRKTFDKNVINSTDIKFNEVDEVGGVDLMNADNSISEFSLEGRFILCKVVNVYDGDTCKIVIEMNGELVKFTCRMNGYDSPEMRPLKSKENREEEKALAKIAKTRLIELVMSDKQLVFAKCGKFDKYGRLLVDLYLNMNSVTNGDDSVNEIMVKEGHGYEYHGGTKRS